MVIYIMVPSSRFKDDRWAGNPNVLTPGGQASKIEKTRVNQPESARRRFRKRRI